MRTVDAWHHSLDGSLNPHLSESFYSRKSRLGGEVDTR
jgi:hypothetical protein